MPDVFMCSCLSGINARATNLHGLEFPCGKVGYGYLAYGLKDTQTSKRQPENRRYGFLGCLSFCRVLIARTTPAVSAAR